MISLMNPTQDMMDMSIISNTYLMIPKKMCRNGRGYNMKYAPTIIKLLGADLEISPLDSGSYFSVSQSTNDGIISLHINDIPTVIKALENVDMVNKAKQRRA